MNKHCKILRLSALRLSQQNIVNSCKASKKTVNRVLKKVREQKYHTEGLSKTMEPTKICCIKLMGALKPFI